MNYSLNQGVFPIVPLRIAKHEKDQTVANPTRPPAPGAGHGSSPTLTTAALS